MHLGFEMLTAQGASHFLQKYKERSLIQPLLWPPNNTYPLIFNQYIYFFASKENRKTFMLNPLKYLRQPKPMQPLPLKLAVIGPPKSGKTTGEIHKKHTVHHNCLEQCFFVYSLILLCCFPLCSCTDVCSAIWFTKTVCWQCYTHSAWDSGPHWSGCSGKKACLTGPCCARSTDNSVPGGGTAEFSLQHTRVK